MALATLNDTELFYQVAGLGLDHTYLQPWLEPRDWPAHCQPEQSVQVSPVPLE